MLLLYLYWTIKSTKYDAYKEYTHQWILGGDSCPLRGACDLCIYIGQYNQRIKKLTNNTLTCGYWEGNTVLDWAGCDFSLYIGQYNTRIMKPTNNIHTCGYLEGLSSLTRRGVISVSISDNIINEVRSLQ